MAKPVFSLAQNTGDLTVIQILGAEGIAIVGYLILSAINSGKVGHMNPGVAPLRGLR